jgi:hypothetical protein
MQSAELVHASESEPSGHESAHVPPARLKQHTCDPPHGVWGQVPPSVTPPPLLLLLLPLVPLDEPDELLEDAPLLPP